MSNIQNTRKFAFNIHSNGRIDAVTMVPGNVSESIPTGIYRVRFCDESKELYLDLSEFPNPPSKVYGNIHKDTARYFKTFETQDICVGVGLYGLKGSGKTTTLQVIAKTALGLDYPVVIVDNAISLSMLSNLFGKIKQNIVVMFDEFDKHYYNAELNEVSSCQNGILSILDGSCGGGKRLTVICANDYDRINQYLKNRPGRIRYAKFYDRLSFPQIMEYLKDRYKKEISKKEFIHLSIMSGQVSMTYDLLKSYVTESEIHNESIVDSIQAVSAEIFDSLEKTGAFGENYPVIRCFDDTDSDYCLRINKDYTSYHITVSKFKTNEFGHKYAEITKVEEGCFSELTINLCDFGFEIQTNKLKLKTKNHLFNLQIQSTDDVVKSSALQSTHNPKDDKSKQASDLSWSARQLERDHEFFSYNTKYNGE